MTTLDFMLGMAIARIPNENIIENEDGSFTFILQTDEECPIDDQDVEFKPTTRRTLLPPNNNP